uniref:DUF3566 domain-containing protein n=1 Tax=Meloidogyne hapla TaxID=6305 RepID=A0A1I8BPH7_MELHA
MSGGSSMANKEILVKVPAHLGLASDTLLFRLDGEGTLPLATIGRLLPGAYLTYKDNKDKKVYPVWYVFCIDNRSLMAAVLVSGFFAICLTINGILVGIFVIAMDNIDEMKRSTERLMHDLESLKQGTENLKLDETYKKLRNNGN